MAIGKIIIAEDDRIKDALEELIPLIDQRLQEAAGCPMHVFLLAGIQGQSVSVALNDDDPRYSAAGPQSVRRAVGLPSF